MQIHLTPQLRERQLGVLQGLTMDEAFAQQPAAHRVLRGGPTSTRLPGGGESVDDLTQRVVREVERIAALHPGVRGGGLGREQERGKARGFYCTRRAGECERSV